MTRSDPAVLDTIDRQILAALQENARVPHAEIARRVGMATSAVADRVRKLEERGVIRGYSVDLDPRALDWGLLAYVFVRTTDRGEPRTAERLFGVPGVLEVHDVAGEDCYLVKMRAADPEDLYERNRELFADVPAVISTRTTIVMKTLRATTALPIAGLPAANTAPNASPNTTPNTTPAAAAEATDAGRD